MLFLYHGWGCTKKYSPFLFYKSLTSTIMDTNKIIKDLRQFHGTTEYHKHLFTGKSSILITDGCQYIRDKCNAYWLFDALLSYQSHKALK
jgi:hypothetical protein